MSPSRSRTTTETDKSSARRGAEPPIEPDSTEWADAAPIAVPESAPGLKDARRATGKRTGTSTTSVVNVTETPSGDIRHTTPSRDDFGSAVTVSGSAGTSPTSSNSAKRSKHWKTPRNAREWAGQLNSIATGVLNGSIDLEEAKIVSSISRSAAQLLTAEVQRARFLQIEPDLSLEFDQTPEKSPETEENPPKSE